MEKPQTRRERATVKRIVRTTRPVATSREAQLERELADVRATLLAVHRELQELKDQPRATDLPISLIVQTHPLSAINGDTSRHRHGDLHIRDAVSGRSLEGVIDAHVETEVQHVEHRSFSGNPMGSEIDRMVVGHHRVLTLKVELR